MDPSNPAPLLPEEIFPYQPQEAASQHSENPRYLFDNNPHQSPMFTTLKPAQHRGKAFKPGGLFPGYADVWKIEVIVFERSGEPAAIRTFYPADTDSSTDVFHQTSGKGLLSLVSHTANFFVNEGSLPNKFKNRRFWRFTFYLKDDTIVSTPNIFMYGPARKEHNRDNTKPSESISNNNNNGYTFTIPAPVPDQERQIAIANDSTPKDTLPLLFFVACTKDEWEQSSYNLLGLTPYNPSEGVYLLELGAGATVIIFLDYYVGEEKKFSLTKFQQLKWFPGEEEDQYFEFLIHPTNPLRDKDILLSSDTFIQSALNARKTSMVVDGDLAREFSKRIGLFLEETLYPGKYYHSNEVCKHVPFPKGRWIDGSTENVCSVECPSELFPLVVELMWKSVRNLPKAKVPRMNATELLKNFSADRGLKNFKF